MQHRLHDLTGYAIRATDGDLGKVHEFYFDDETWKILYMVVETGNWLVGRKVLVSLIALGKPDWASGTLTVDLSQEQVRNSPDIDTERPVYRQHEVELHKYYQWPLYWESGYGGTFGISPYPLLENSLLQGPSEPRQDDDPHLRSTRHLIGYTIHAIDGEIGHVDDFIVDDENWVLNFLIVDTGEWLRGRKVLITPEWIKNVNWADSSVYLDRTREEVKSSPEFDPLQPFMTKFAFKQKTNRLRRTAV